MMQKIRVFYRAAENLYSEHYQWVEASADLEVDDVVSIELRYPHTIRKAGGRNMETLETLLEQLENLRYRAYLPGSISKVECLD